MTDGKRVLTSEQKKAEVDLVANLQDDHIKAIAIEMSAIRAELSSIRYVLECIAFGPPKAQDTKMDD